MRSRPSDAPPAARPRRGWRIVLTVLAALLLVAAVVGVVAHFRAPGRSWVLAVSAISPYLMLAAPVAAILLVVARQWLGLAAAVLVVIVCVSTQSRLYVAERAPGGSVRLVAMTANLRLGRADAPSVVRAVREHHVELLTVQELTESELAALQKAGLDDVLPYHAADARYSATGTGMWSRYPLTSVDKRTDFTFAFVTAKVTVPGVSTPVDAVALHASGPVPSSSLWQADMAHLPSVLRGLSGGGSVVVGGDFNATPDIAQFRDLLVDGYADAAQQAGAGMTRTYPANTWYPPLIAIDHVLTRRAVATRADTIHIPGSDHRALLVSVAIPR